MLSKVLVAFVPTGLIGFALYRVVKAYFFDSDTVVLWALGLGGVALIIFELLHQERDDAVDDVASISYSKALLIGLFQSISIVPVCREPEPPLSEDLFLDLLADDRTILVPARGAHHVRCHRL